jgi:prephenate dehydrogenase
MEGSIAIIGLGYIGTSLGLALREKVPDVEIRGHDRDAEFANAAQVMGAVTKTYGSMRAACKGADMVIVALPLPAVRATMKTIGPHLKEGCIVTDAAHLKIPVLDAVREHLPENARYVPATPIPGPAVEAGQSMLDVTAAKADAFENGLYCIAPASDTDPDAITFVVDFARTIGANPLFLDPAEHDGLQTGVIDLPHLLAVTLLRMTVDSPGWSDMRKVAGYDFANLTDLIATNPVASGESAFLNRENLILRLDMLIAELHRLRRDLEEGDLEAVEKIYVDAFKGRAKWLHERAQGVWERPDVDDIPTFKDQMTEMFVGGLFKRRRPPREDD